MGGHHTLLLCQDCKTIAAHQSLIHEGGIVVLVGSPSQSSPTAGPQGTFMNFPLTFDLQVGFMVSSTKFGHNKDHTGNRTHDSALYEQGQAPLTPTCTATTAVHDVYWGV